MAAARYDVPLDAVCFLKRMPKIELHAHFSGSLKKSAIIRMKDFIGMDEEQIEEEFGDLHVFDDMNGCFEKFKRIQELLCSQTTLFYAVLSSLVDFANENIIYLELRTTPRVVGDIVSKSKYLETVINALSRAQSIHSSMIVKLLPSIDRGRGINDARETLEAVLRLKRIYPNFLPGIDFGGNPNSGRFRDYRELLVRARQNGLKVVLHCAEINNPEEINEMMEFGMDRCGHGTFLSENQIRHLKAEAVPIECCITSNLRCGTVARIEDHPFNHMFHDIRAPVLLSTDDRGIFNTDLTDEFIKARTAFKLSKPNVKTLLLNSINGAFVTESQRAHYRNQVDQFFQKYMCVM